jgi:hypothetical protein
MAASTCYAVKSRGPPQRAWRDTVLSPALVQLWKATTASTGRTSCGKRAPGRSQRGPRSGRPADAGRRHRSGR